MCRRTKAICLAGILAVSAASAWALWQFDIVGAPAVFMMHFRGTRFDIPEVANGPWGERPVEKMAMLVGVPIEVVQEQFGTPNQEYEFPVDGGLPEFRCELLNT